MQSEEEADDAIKNLDGFTIKGNRMRVEVCGIDNSFKGNFNNALFIEYRQNGYIGYRNNHYSWILTLVYICFSFRQESQEVEEEEGKLIVWLKESNANFELHFWTSLWSFLT